MKSCLALFLALSLPAFGGKVALFSSDFEDEVLVKQQWTVEGTASDIAIVSSEKAASGKRSLALVDKDTATHAAWFSKAVDLPPAVLKRGYVNISWKQLHSIWPSHAMRFSVVFIGTEHSKSTKHFTMKGDSPKWSGGKFTVEQHKVPIPVGATQLRLKLSSAVERGADGEVYIDDLSVSE